MKIRAMMISGRLLSRDNIYDAVEEACKILLVTCLYWLSKCGGLVFFLYAFQTRTFSYLSYDST